MTFPTGPGNGQSPVDQMRPVIKDPHSAVVDNEPESDGPSDFPRPQPTDPAGTSSAGFVKTKEYGDGYYSPDVDSGGFRQV